MRRIVLLCLATVLWPGASFAHEYADTVRVNIGKTVDFHVRDAGTCAANVWIDQIADPSLVSITPSAGFGIVVNFTVQAGSRAGLTDVTIQWTGEHVGQDEGNCKEDTRDTGGRHIVIRVTPDQVNSADDRSDFIPGDGFCDTGKDVSRGANAEPQCTLRAAIQEANAGGDASITFDVADGGNPARIGLRKSLPAITVPVTIIGTPGAGKRLAVPGVTIDGAHAPIDGLTFAASASGSRVQGVALVGLANGIVIQADEVVVVQCHVGLTAAGVVNGNGTGIRIDGGFANVVGGTSDGDRNIVSGNEDYGIHVVNASQNLIFGNWIGLSVDGSTSAGNGKGGVLIEEGGNNAVGAPVATAGDAPGNRFAGNGPEGAVILHGDNHLVRGNLIGGRDIAGAVFANIGPGVAIEGVANTVGGADAEDGNVIAFNDSTGISITSVTSERNMLRRNLIYENGGLAIDLGADGPTANDPGTGVGDADSDVGINLLQNYPVALLAKRNPSDFSKRLITGIVDHPHPERLIIELYSSEKPSSVSKNRTRFGVAQVFVDTTRANDKGIIRKVVSPDRMPYKYASGIAIDPEGNTSEVSWVCDDTDGDGSMDNDDDGACDDWETIGIDYDGNGTLDFDVTSLDPRPSLEYADIFVEVDWMVGYRPVAGVLDDVKAAFAAAPKKHRLHVIEDGEVPLIDPIRFGDTPEAGEAGTFADLRYGKPVNPCGTAPGNGHFGRASDRSAPDCGARLGARTLIFRYAVFGRRYAEDLESSGVATIFGNNFLVTTGSWSDRSVVATAGRPAGTSAQAARRIIEASTFMHELGHTLGLLHGGRQYTNCKPNYPSIMSYALQFPAMVPSRPMTYSRESLSTLAENALIETAGLRGRYDRTVPYKGGAEVRFTSTRSATVDWNGDAATSREAVAEDISNLADWCRSAGLSSLSGNNDWVNNWPDFRPYKGFSVGGSPPLGPGEDEEKVTEAAMVEAAETTDFDLDGHANAADNCPAIFNPDQADDDLDGVGNACEGAIADLALSMDGTDPGAATVTFSLTAYNFGPDDASDVAVVDTLGFWYTPGTVTSTDGDCTVTDRIIRCEIAHLAVGDSVVVTFDATASEPGLTGNMAHVSYASDPDPYNNSAEFVGATAVAIERPIAASDIPPGSFAIEAPYPNPFRFRTRLTIDLPSRETVRVAVFDVTGREVATLVNGVLPAGRHEAIFEAEGHPPGVYLIRTMAGSRVEVHNVVLVR